MVFYLFLLFAVVPLAELVVLLQFHGALSALTGPGFGLVLTVLSVVGVGVIGAALARQQGLKTLAAIQESLARSEIPTDSLVDGALIMLGGVLLLTPGFLSDIVGITFLLPPTRALYRAYAKRWMQQQLASGRVFVRATGTAWFSSTGFSFPPNIRRIDPEGRDQNTGDKP